MLAYTVVMFAWPAAIYARYPDVTDLWFFDLGGRVSGNYTVTNAPLWYYPVNMLWMCAPWTVLVPFGLWATWKRCWNEPTSPERFLWCWAFVVPIVFSIPGGKHHHYLLHALSPWAIFGILGARKLREVVPTWPRLLRSPSLSLVTVALPAIVALVIFHKQIPGPVWLPLRPDGGGASGRLSDHVGHASIRTRVGPARPCLPYWRSPTAAATCTAPNISTAIATTSNS